LKLFQRFSSSLFAPKEIVKFRHDRWWTTLFYFLCLALILVIPPIISTVQSDMLSYDAKKEIRNHFNSEESIPFSIVNGVLVHDTNDPAYVYQTSLYNFDIIMTVGDDIGQKTTDTNLYLVFKSDGVYVKQMFLNRKLFDYDDYPILNGIHFSSASSYHNHEFWDTIFTVANQEIKVIKPIFNFINIFYIVVGTIIDLLIVTLIITVFQMFTAYSYIKFIKLYQLSIYVITPYVIGNLLSYLFNFNLLYYIGFLISIIYMSILSRTIIRDSMRRS